MREVKLLTVGDQHLDTTAPSSRKDDYFQAICNKLTEIRQLAMSLCVAGVIWKGDMINKQDGHRVPYYLINWLIDYFASYPEQIPNFIALGNHDIRSVPSNWHRQPIGALVKSGKVYPLWSSSSTELELEGGARSYALPFSPEIRIHGKLFDYHSDDNQETRAKHYAIDRGIGSYHIMVTHSGVIPDGEIMHGPYSNPSHIAAAVPPDRAADLYVCGHIHDNLGMMRAAHIQVLNYGSLARGTIDEYNLRRDVMVGLLTLTKQDTSWQLKAEPIVLQSARPAAEVFRVQELEQAKRKDSELDQLAAALQAGKLLEEFRLLDPNEALEVVLKARQIRPSVQQMVRDYVKTSRQELE